MMKDCHTKQSKRKIGATSSSVWFDIYWALSTTYVSDCGPVVRVAKVEWLSFIGLMEITKEIAVKIWYGKYDREFVYQYGEFRSLCKESGMEAEIWRINVIYEEKGGGL